MRWQMDKIKNELPAHHGMTMPQFFLSKQAIEKLRAIKEAATKKADATGVNPLLIMLYEKLTPRWIMMGEPHVVKTEKLGEVQ